MKTFVRVLALVLVLQLALLPVGGALAAEVGGKYISSAGACVMDYTTGEILYEYKGDVPLVPASMTKIMNVYCVYEAIANGEISMSTVVPISKKVYDISRNSLYTNVVPLYYNQTYTVDEMLSVVVAHSASGAAVALAELVGGGSEDAFVARMNAKAAEMGINAYYYDSCGIANNQVTPVAMVTLARNIIRDYPDILNRSSLKSVYFHGNTYKTTNHLLDTYYYEGADGLKTGTTSAAKYCFCGTAVRNGRRIIAVTMRSSSTDQRFVDISRLLDYGFEVAAKNYNTLSYTSNRVFIDGMEMPTFECKGEAPVTIVVENLSYYGFDVSYDSDTRTVTAVRNISKQPVPMDVSPYKGKDGAAFTIYRNRNINVVIHDGVTAHRIGTAYDLGGCTGISADEFRSIYQTDWSESDRALYINTSVSRALPYVGGELLTSQCAFIMDYDTGNELFAYRADEQRPVASIAKMMSVYVVMDAIKNGEVTLDTVVPISRNVYDLSRREDYKMMVNLDYGQTYTLDEMLDMIVIDSAAACVTAVAELLCGSEAKFVERMNQKAREIGIGSVFYNGTGVCLNPATEKENLMSAREVAIMARKMINDYPEILERTKRDSVYFHGQTYYNLNKLFTDYYYAGADGFKNGMTDASGYCMCGTAWLGGKRLITVTLPSDSNESRFTDTIKMFNYGFSLLGVDTSWAQVKPEVPAIPTDGPVEINIDGNYVMNFDGPQPYFSNGALMAPARALMETLLKYVEWKGDTGQTAISDDTVTVYLTPGSPIMVKTSLNVLDGSVSAENIDLPSAAETVDGTLFVPVKEVAEAFGYTVVWDYDTGVLLIIAGVC